MEKRIAEILLEIEAITLNTKQPYKYVSGILSPIYTDCRLLMGYPEKRAEVIECMAEKAEKEIGKESIDVIAGVASSGIPHAAWLANRLKKPMIYARKQEKDHGKQNLIEGVLKDGDKVLLIEDLISTGKSSLEAVHTIEESKGLVKNCLAIFTYEIPKAEESFKENNINLLTLTNLTALIEVAASTGKINESDKEIILDWAKDTKEWGKKHGFE